MWLARHIKKNVSKTLEFPLISCKNFETYSYSMYIWFSPEAKKSRQSGQFLIVCKLLVYVVITAIFATNTNPTITKTFLTSEGIAQAIITQNVTFRSGFHAKSTHFNPLHRFQNLSMLPFLATAVRSMVCDCVTHRKSIKWEWYRRWPTFLTEQGWSL